MALYVTRKHREKMKFFETRQAYFINMEKKQLKQNYTKMHQHLEKANLLTIKYRIYQFLWILIIIVTVMIEHFTHFFYKSYFPERLFQRWILNIFKINEKNDVFLNNMFIMCVTQPKSRLNLSECSYDSHEDFFKISVYFLFLIVFAYARSHNPHEHNVVFSHSLLASRKLQ